MTDLATVAITLGPASITGVVAWFGAKYQRDTSQAETDEATARIRLEQQEARRKQREERYHDYVMVLNRLDLMLIGHAEFSQEQWEAWLEAHFEALTWAKLGSSEAVRERLGVVGKQLESMGAAVVDDDESEDPWFEQFASVYNDRRSAFLAAREGAISAMRTELSP